MAVSVAEGKNAQNATTTAAAATTAVFPATTTNTGVVVVVVLPLGCFFCWCQLCW